MQAVGGASASPARTGYAYVYIINNISLLTMTSNDNSYKTQYCVNPNKLGDKSQIYYQHTSVRVMIIIYYTVIVSANNFYVYLVPCVVRSSSDLL
jgi:hypothetical protein